MKFGINRNLLSKAVLWMAPVALLSAAALYAQWPQSYGYNEDYDHALRHHQRDEKRALRDHQREERWYYGDSWALRQHQREEQRELKHHQRHERSYDDFNRFYDRRDHGYSSRGWYEDRHHW